MANTIKVDPAKLTSTANSFNNSSSQVKGLSTQMTSIVNTLSGSVWTGDAANAYKKKFTGLQNDLNKITKMISEHVTDLNAMAKQYEAAEKANTTAANALANDIIS